MNILIESFSSAGGSGMVSARLSHYLARRGHNVHILSDAVPFAVKKPFANMFVHSVEIPEYPLFTATSHLTFHIGTAMNIIENHGIDIIHAHYVIPHGLSAVITRDIFGKVRGMAVKTVVTAHGTDIILWGKEINTGGLVKYVIGEADAVTAVSGFLANRIRELVPCARVHVIPNFIENVWDVRTKKSKNEHFRRRMGIPMDVPVILHISNMRGVKRVMDFLKIAYEIIQKRKCRVVIVGDGPERNKAEAFIHEHGIERYVMLPGVVDCPDVYYAISDVVVVTSEVESFSLVCLEGLSRCIPVVATNTGGIPEYIKHGENGLLCDVGNIEQFVSSIIKLLDDSELRDKLVENGIKTAVNYISSRICPLYEKLYKELVGGKG